MDSNSINQGIPKNMTAKRSVSATKMGIKRFENENEAFDVVGRQSLTIGGEQQPQRPNQQHRRQKPEKRQSQQKKAHAKVMSADERSAFARSQAVKQLLCIFYNEVHHHHVVFATREDRYKAFVLYSATTLQAANCDNFLKKGLSCPLEKFNLLWDQYHHYLQQEATEVVEQYRRQRLAAGGVDVPSLALYGASSVRQPNNAITAQRGTRTTNAAVPGALIHKTQQKTASVTVIGEQNNDTSPPAVFTTMNRAAGRPSSMRMASRFAPSIGQSTTLFQTKEANAATALMKLSITTPQSQTQLPPQSLSSNTKTADHPITHEGSTKAMSLAPPLFTKLDPTFKEDLFRTVMVGNASHSIQTTNNKYDSDWDYSDDGSIII